MKKIFRTILIMTALWTLGAQASDSSLIVVNGVAEKSLDPNMMSLTIEVWSRATTAKQAQQLAATQYKQIKKTLDDFKIKKEDVQTDNYALNPDYEFDQKTRQNKMIGFRVSQTLLVTLRKVEDGGNFIDALVADKKTLDSGVNLNSINWDSDKKAQTETATLGDAVKAARVKAEEIAKAAGVKIKGVSKITHNTSGGGGGPVLRNYSLKAMESASSTEVAAGQIKVRVEVTAEYDID